MPNRRIRVVSTALIGAAALAAGCADSPSAPRGAAPMLDAAPTRDAVFFAEGSQLEAVAATTTANAHVPNAVDAADTNTAAAVTRRSGFMVSTARSRSFVHEN